MGKKATKKQKKARLKYTLFALMGIMAIALGFVLSSQEQKLGEIAKERASVDEEYLRLENERIQLERMIEYSKSDEYLLQYARERLGYVMPSDVKVLIDERIIAAKQAPSGSAPADAGDDILDITQGGEGSAPKEPPEGTAPAVTPTAEASTAPVTPPTATAPPKTVAQPSPAGE